MWTIAGLTQQSRKPQSRVRRRTTTRIKDPIPGGSSAGHPPNYPTTKRSTHFTINQDQISQKTLNLALSASSWKLTEALESNLTRYLIPGGLGIEQFEELGGWGVTVLLLLRRSLVRFRLLHDRKKKKKRWPPRLDRMSWLGGKSPRVCFNVTGRFYSVDGLLEEVDWEN